MKLPIAFLLLFSFQAHSATTKWAVTIAQDHGIVEFTAIGMPSALKIHGKGEGPKGEFQIENGKAQGQVTFDLRTLDTGISMRNNHMKKKYLETDKFSDSTLRVTQMTLPTDFEKNGTVFEHIPFDGLLTVHGVEQPVKGEVKLTTKDGVIAVEAAFETKVKDYKIETPSFAGITMADTVKVNVQFSASLKSM